jgi:uracil-DNA glycosylase
MRSSFPHELTEWLAQLDGIAAPPDAEYLYSASGDPGRLRRANLLHYLSFMVEQQPTTMFIGEAPGYRGTTVTGVPFMSITELSARPGLISASDDGDGFEIPLGSSPTREATSAAMWKTLRSLPGQLPLLWSSYPNHPFEPGNPLSNRAPRPAEVAAGVELAMRLAGIFDIRRFVAVGRIAQNTLAKRGVEAIAVRHPAQGGSLIFDAQVKALLGKPQDWPETAGWPLSTLD